DLVIASQTAADWKGSLDLDIADRLALACGRPVLIVPNRGSHQPVPKRVVVGWTDQREAARATFDALPLLRRADEVRLIEVDPRPAAGSEEMRARLCASLARQGVSCTEGTAASPHGNVGAGLLACCEQTKAELLVMGCYGHSRLREFVLGGASRHLLEAMTVPVLMSH